MAKYRKRPVVVEAVQWFKHGDHAEVTRCGRQEFDALTDNKTNVAGWGWDACGVVGTREGRHLVMPGDWIIRGVANEFYPCKDSIFKATYEEV